MTEIKAKMQKDGKSDYLSEKECVNLAIERVSELDPSLTEDIIGLFRKYEQTDSQEHVAVQIFNTAFQLENCTLRSLLRLYCSDEFMELLQFGNETSFHMTKVFRENIDNADLLLSYMRDERFTRLLHVVGDRTASSIVESVSRLVGEADQLQDLLKLYYSDELKNSLQFRDGTNSKIAKVIGENIDDAGLLLPYLQDEMFTRCLFQFDEFTAPRLIGIASDLVSDNMLDRFMNFLYRFEFWEERAKLTDVCWNLFSKLKGPASFFDLLDNYNPKEAARVARAICIGADIPKEQLIDFAARHKEHVNFIEDVFNDINYRSLIGRDSDEVTIHYPEACGMLQLWRFDRYVRYELLESLESDPQFFQVVSREKDFLIQQSSQTMIPLAAVMSSLKEYRPQIKLVQGQAKMDLVKAYSIAKDNIDETTGKNCLEEFYDSVKGMLDTRPDDLGRWAASICSDFRKQGEKGLLRGVVG